MILVKEKHKNLKGTVEQRIDNIYISTLWDKNKGSEVDREVVEFETYSAALADMYKRLYEALKEQ